MIFNNFIDDILTRIDLGDRSYVLDVLAPFLIDFRSTIFDYLSGQDFVTIIDECKQVYDSMIGYEKETAERIKSLKESENESNSCNIYDYASYRLLVLVEGLKFGLSFHYVLPQ